MEDRMKGKAKEAWGALTSDEAMKEEGQVQQRKADAEEDAAQRQRTSQAKKEARQAERSGRTEGQGRRIPGRRDRLIVWA